MGIFNSVSVLFLTLIIAIACGDSKGIPGVSGDVEEDGLGLECDSFNLSSEDELDEIYSELGLNAEGNDLVDDEIESLSLAKGKDKNKDKKKNKESNTMECDDEKSGKNKKRKDDKKGKDKEKKDKKDKK